MFKTLGFNSSQSLFLRIIFLSAALVFIALAYNPLNNFYADVFTSLRIQLLFLALVCGLLLLALKLYKIGGGVLLICVIGLAPLLFSFSSPSSTDGRVLTVKQINLNYNNKDIETHLSILLQQKWDIVILQEFSDKNRNLLSRFLTTTDMFGYEEVEGIPYGIVVISRIPMVYKHQIKLDADRLGYLKIKFLFDDKLLTAFVAHPPSPRSKQHWQNRNTLLAALNTAAHEEQNPWIIAGDLNTVPWSSYFNWSDSKTCFDKSRYVSFMPFEKGRSTLTGLPIDHCIMSEKISLHRLEVNDFKGSDHKMLSYDLTIN
ncbi:hypothetical protein P20652_1680 [Pseudoalteromonas sp. BSi20652]|uniref:endonuclease/exonuclease/phosphatase family protein n=1 Tax=Pseudoalteromonas sp. BSi20652 TaxID=388384 RepID=UPI00023175E4|nr:endonuclease/exonuclease/phosphatase family protein [Pseudoalteromonas sp. BSi20652]GAA59816.1 hypothetical protein P20652_1680 [Pseudoalteromonas sp. BSi20652]